MTEQITKRDVSSFCSALQWQPNIAVNLTCELCLSSMQRTVYLKALLLMRQGLAHWLDVCKIHTTPAAVLGNSAQCFSALHTAVLGMVLLGAPLGAYCT